MREVPLYPMFWVQESVVRDQARADMYRGTSPLKNRLPLGPYGRPMPRALRWSWGGGGGHMSEVPLWH